MSSGTTLHKGTPADKAAVPFSIPKTAAVIGSGIAGACVAHALRHRGLAVNVYEQHPHPAAEASGNPAGIVMLRLDRGAHAMARFQRQAFMHAVAFYEGLGTYGFTTRGVLDRMHDSTKRTLLLAANLFPESDLYEQNGALLHRLAGVIDPATTIKHLLQGCTIKTSAAVNNLTTLTEDIVVVAAGRGMAALTGLELRYHAGQVEWMPHRLTITPIMGDGYALTHNNALVFGATFDRWADPQQYPQTTAAAKEANIARLAVLLPDVAVHETQSRAALRVATADRLPIAGHLRDNIYCIGALGARGLTLAPLLAESLACTIVQQALPVNDDVWQLLQPGRLLSA